MTICLSLLLRRLLPLWVFFAANVLVPPVGWGYDAHNQASTVYDGTSFPIFNYDSAPVPVADEKENRPAGTSGPFADFAEFLAAKSANLADNIADAARLRNQLASQEIAGGHAFGKHVAKEGQFPGVTTPQQFGAHIENIMNNPSAIRHLSNGQTAYWDGASGTVVIRNPGAIDGGTAFKPTQGKTYFDNLK